MKLSLVALLFSAVAPLVSSQGNTIADLVQTDPSMTYLSGLLGNLGLLDDLAVDGSFTLFAPSDDAFGAVALELESWDTDLLMRCVLYHVISGEAIPRTGFVSGTEYPLNAVPLDIAAIPNNPNFIYVSGTAARVVGTSIVASNGIIHRVNKVLIPPPPLPKTTMNGASIGNVSASTSGGKTTNNGAGGGDKKKKDDKKKKGH